MDMAWLRTPSTLDSPERHGTKLYDNDAKFEIASVLLALLSKYQSHKALIDMDKDKPRIVEIRQVVFDWCMGSMDPALLVHFTIPSPLDDNPQDKLIKTLVTMKLLCYIHHCLSDAANSTKFSTGQVVPMLIQQSPSVVFFAVPGGMSFAQ
ncbi:hypothetical protein GGF32_006361 [Allomyces javanicus]|nr:hypothetical protein GGF32_006361 [Allomyces javanicus]